MTRKPAAAPKPSPPTSRKRRSRPTPHWLMKQQDLDDMARRRCLMVLSVLSGEVTVSDAIEQAQISRGTYYQLEERALRAMLASLIPGATDDGSTTSAAQRVAQLEQKISRLEQDKRRLERLLWLTKKVLKRGPVTTSAGRPPKAPRSATSGSSRLRGSKKKAKTETASASPSTPTPGGEAAP